MSKTPRFPEKKRVLKHDCVHAIISCVLTVLPQAAPEDRAHVIDEVTAELEILKPIIIPVKNKRKTA